MLRRISAAIAVALVSMLAGAQDFPSRPIRIIVAYSAGGLPDVIARILVEPLSARLGQPVTVENLPGSNGVAAINALLAAPADGHTILSADAAHWAIYPAMTPKLPYDPVKDFAPVGLYGQNNGFILVVNPAVPAQTLQELITLAKARPGALSYASAGFGTAHHLVMEDFKSELGLDILHVPYKGTAQALPAVMGGQVSMTVSAAYAITLGHAKEGTVRILGVSTRKRSPLAPDVPAISEVIPGFEHRTALGFVVRAGTPQAIIDKLSAALASVIANPEVAARFQANGVEPVTDASPRALGVRIDQDRTTYARVVKRLPPAPN
jgi:tripartite-type tricarboxylate transporter receptor subunit TctC